MRSQRTNSAKQAGKLEDPIQVTESGQQSLRKARSAWLKPCPRRPRNASEHVTVIQETIV